MQPFRTVAFTLRIYEFEILYEFLKLTVEITRVMSYNNSMIA